MMGVENPKAVWTCFFFGKKNNTTEYSTKTPLTPSAQRTVTVCARRTDQEIDRSPVLFKGCGNVQNQRN